MEIRTQTPESGNKFYTVKSAGGVSPCILGNAKNRAWEGSTLVNCVGAAEGRFNELIGSWRYFVGEYPYAAMDTARRQGLAIGQTPRPGAMLVWYSNDHSSQHVASCEKVEGDYFYLWSSGWNYTKNTSTFTKVTAASNYGMPARYVYRGCIYNPQIDPYKCTLYYMKRGFTGESVKYLQWALNKEGCYTAGSNNLIDGSFGPATDAALRVFQASHGLDVDGSAGPLTQAVINKLYTLQ